ncbi:hypothetical protein B9Z55_027307 [Caenorhabditis nigoni]|nr:hypothetical protein B9Z55_027307 [Caenorhabditis nigoni]
MMPDSEAADCRSLCTRKLLGSFTVPETRLGTSYDPEKNFFDFQNIKSQGRFQNLKKLPWIEQTSTCYLRNPLSGARKRSSKTLLQQRPNQRGAFQKKCAVQHPMILNWLPQKMFQKMFQLLVPQFLNMEKKSNFLKIYFSLVAK